MPQVVDALDAAFYAAFANVEPTGKRWLLALDVSSSMEGGQIAFGGNVAGADADGAQVAFGVNVTPANWFDNTVPAASVSKVMVSALAEPAASSSPGAATAKEDVGFMQILFIGFEPVERAILLRHPRPMHT